MAEPTNVCSQKLTTKTTTFQTHEHKWCSVSDFQVCLCFYHGCGRSQGNILHNSNVPMVLCLQPLVQAIGQV